MRRLLGIILAAAAPCFIAPVAVAVDLTPLEEVGKSLFFDANLSTPPGQACAACHDPGTGFVGPISGINSGPAVYPGAIHTRFGNRKPPSAAYATFSPDFHYDEQEGLYVGGMFWDGRARNTIEQAKGPFLNPVEQNNPNKRHVIIRIMKSDYAGRFLAQYAAWLGGGMEPSAAAIPELGFDIGSADFVESAYQFMAEAISAYEGSPEVNRFSSRYDAYLAGMTSLTDQEMWGLELYEGKAMCAACHPSQPGPGGEPPLFTDFTYDNLGVPKNPMNPWYTTPPGFNPDGADWIDYGLGGVLGIPEEMGKVKVPTLRNVGMRPFEGFVQAYMHNGFFKSLEDVVHFYNTRDVEPWPAPEVPENVNVDELGDLGLTADEEAAIVAFLNTLTDGWMDMTTAPAARTVSGASANIVAGSSPNPFRSDTRIAFQLDAPAAVAITVFDVQGRMVRNLLESSGRPAGRHAVAWDGRDEAGRATAPGIFFVQIRSGSATATERLIRLP